MWRRASLLVLLTVGCTRWRASPLTPHQVVAATPYPKRIRVILTDKSVLVLKDPVISGDSIAGWSSGMRIAVNFERIAHTDVDDRRNDELDFLASWGTQRGTPQHVISTTQVHRVRLTLLDTSVVVLEYPVSLGDSIIGWAEGTRSAVASRQITRTQTRVPNLWKLTAAVTLYAALYFALGGDSVDQQ